MIFWDIGLLILGLLILLFTGDFLVRGAVGIAQKIHIPPLLIGLTIVAFGTSAPELVVSVNSALDGHAGIALGNVVGSNIANVFMVLGIPALMVPTICADPRAAHNGYILLAITAVFTILIFYGPLVWWHALILLAFLAFYLGDNARYALAERRNAQNRARVDQMSEIEGVDSVPQSYPIIIVFLFAGLIGLPIAAEMTVDGAVGIAKFLGVSDAVIGLTIVAIGTSLPELAATIAASRRDEHAMAMGNIIGSNIFNLVAITGITAAIVPMQIPPKLLQIDIWVMIIATLSLLPFVLWKQVLSKWVAAIFVSCYVIYIASNFI